MSGSSESRYIRLDGDHSISSPHPYPYPHTLFTVISGSNLLVPSERIPAGIYVSINIDSQIRWKSATGVLSSEESVVWGDTVILSSDASPVLSVEIRASYEAYRMLGSGEVIGKLQMSWDEILNHRDKSFDLSFPPVRGVHPSLTLKAAVVQACDDQDGALPNSLVDCEMTRHTDAGHAQFAEYVASETVSHLNAAVENFQLVLDQCPASHPDHAAALTNLAWVGLLGYVRNDLQDIDTTISLFRDALALRPQCHPDRPFSLYSLTESLTWHHNKKGTAADIREAAQLYHELLPLCPEGTYLRSIASGKNGVDYVIVGCNSLPTDASDEGICLRRVVLELCPLGHQLRPRALDELSRALFSRFTQSGNIDDLDESIQFLREAMSLCPERHTDRAVYLDNLAILLGSCRFRHQGNPNDLDEAIYLHEEALRLHPVGHESRDSSLRSLGCALVTRFNNRGAIDDITRAISLLREALTLCPPGHCPHRDVTLNNLANALKTRYDKLNVSEDLNEAIDLCRESLRLKGLDDPERHVTLLNLSGALCSRFTDTRKNEDIEDVIDLCQKSLDILPSLHPDRFLSYMWLAEAYLSRYRVQLNPSNLSLAVENFRLASGHPTQGFPYRIQMALNWVVAAESYQHDSALEAYQVCLELFDSHVMTRSSIIARREAASAFRGAQSFPVDAASCAIRRGNLPRAVELMEQGRGQQWSLISSPRVPELARKVSELNKRLAGAQGSAGSTDRAAADRAATKYRALTRQWESAVAEIRNLPGFSRFLLPPAYEDLQAAARHGPVIVLIASQYSCGAIIVSTSGEPHHVPLPSITLADLMILKDRFTRAIRHASRMNPAETRTDLIVLLRTIWDEVMLPIVDVLENVLKVQRRSRIWLCPTAAFTSIPLHAANPFLTKADRSKEPCLEDLYICSYTPTLSALPGAGKGKALLAVDSELELVRELVPATANRTTISGDAATRAGALEALEANTWVHLACHGKQDPAQPYHSHFVMRDEHLTLLDIMERDIPHMPIIHLAAGLQFSGFKSVVGTLWEVDDSVAKHVVEAFYKYMFHPKEAGVMDCTKAAWALNCATHAVKTKVPLEQRMVFIHIGV
ncbi:hypothetical protein EDD22DRAFT_962374 [Suillus occidentalis]|nr:hypothetical protein EDD22DRAFT_962374 [Suillus occidentalis]